MSHRVWAGLCAGLLVASSASAAITLSTLLVVCVLFALGIFNSLGNNIARRLCRNTP